MLLFPSPEVNEFFDNRLIISWNLFQPPNLPPLENLIIRISGEPELNFDPLQDPQAEIPEINDNNFIINWIIRKPSVRTEVIFSIQNDTISEEQILIINPETYTKTKQVSKEH